MKNHHMPKEMEREKASLKAYVLAFVVCISFTLGAYFLVTEHALSGIALFATIGAFGLTQSFFQLVFFLHLGDEPKPYSNFLVFIFMVSVLLLLVIGSLWIMYHLDYRMEM